MVERSKVAQSQFPNTALSFEVPKWKASQQSRLGYVGECVFPVSRSQSVSGGELYRGTRAELLFNVMCEGKMRDTRPGMGKGCYEGVYMFDAARAAKCNYYAIGVPLGNTRFFVRAIWKLILRSGAPKFGNAKTLGDQACCAATDLVIASLHFLVEDITKVDKNLDTDSYQPVWDAALEFCALPLPPTQRSGKTIPVKAPPAMPPTSSSAAAARSGVGGVSSSSGASVTRGAAPQGESASRATPVGVA